MVGAIPVYENPYGEYRIEESIPHYKDPYETVCTKHLRNGHYFYKIPPQPDENHVVLFIA